MDQELVAELYRNMFRIRRFEEEAARLYTEGKIYGYLHSYKGQEAVAVGAISVLESQDKVLSSHRCHGHYLALGGSLEAGFAELLGKESGCSKGRGGSMHFFAPEHNFYGGWGIVGAHVPLAAGMAFAQKYKKDDGVSLCFLGDGAVNIGAFHEGLSLAALWKLPVVYIVENNYFAMGTPLEKTLPTDDLSIRALGYPMARATVDGHDVFAVRAATHTAVRRAREQQLPTLIEAKTYHLRGDALASNSKTENLKGPIGILAEKMLNLEMEDIKNKIETEVEEEMNRAIEVAQSASEVVSDTALNYVYS